MRITALTRFKHADLHHALSQLGWSQAELARRVGVSGSFIGKILKLESRPSEAMAIRIERVFGEEGIALDILEGWKEGWKLNRGAVIEQTKDIELFSLEDTPEALLLPAPEPLDPEIENLINHAMRHLTVNERRAIEGAFFEGQSHEEIAQAGEWFQVRGAIHRALWKMRHDIEEE